MSVLDNKVGEGQIPAATWCKLPNPKAPQPRTKDQSIDALAYVELT